MIRGFDKTSDVSRSQLRELWGLERQVLAEVEGAVLVLGSSRGKWSAKGRDVLFSDPHALDVLNARMAAIERLTQVQNELRQRNADLALSKMETIKR